MVHNNCLCFLGWYDTKPYSPGFTLLFQELSQQGLHTAEGMGTYCLKDMGEYNGWERYMHEQVTQDELQAGFDLYVMFGSPDKQNVVTLTRTNLLEQAYSFWKIMKRKGCFSTTLTPVNEVLWAMLQAGNF